MNYKNKNLEELGKKIDDLDNQNKVTTKTVISIASDEFVNEML